MRTALALCLSLFTGPALAECIGVDFRDRLSDDQSARVAQAVAQTPYPEGLLWTATRGDETLHLIGTMHLYDTRLDPIFDAARPLVESAEVLLVEATAKEEELLQASLTENPEQIFIVDGPTLPEQLDEDTWAAISEAAKARQLPPFLAAKMQPWYLSLTLAIPTCAMPDVIAGARGLDHMLMGAATEAGISQQALEPHTILFDLMNQGTFEEQIEMLQLGMLDSDMQSEMHVAMLNAYFAGDIAEVWETSRIALEFVEDLDPARGEELFAEVQTGLLDDRNLAWMPVIYRALKDVDTAAVAVGAAHFPGEMGVLNLLEQDGWTITPLQ